MGLRGSELLSFLQRPRAGFPREESSMATMILSAISARIFGGKGRNLTGDGFTQQSRTEKYRAQV